MRARFSKVALASLAFALPVAPCACKTHAAPEEVTPPAPASAPAASGPIDAGPGLTKEEIRDVVDAARPWLRRLCLRDASLDATHYVVHLMVDPDGRVGAATVDGGDKGIDKCIEDEARRWRFSTGPAKFDLPLHFIGGEDASAPRHVDRPR